jgi:galactokinase
MNTAERKQVISDQFKTLFGEKPTVWVQAPGRVDLMGSHTDYNEGFVLTMSVDRNTWIAAAPREDGVVAIHSMNVDGYSEFSLDDIQRSHYVPWTNYVKGIAKILQGEGYALSGFNGLLHSTVPFGSGLSSSAALEIATATLFRALSLLSIDPVRVAVLAQRAENEFVGVNCGILDQYTSAMGRAGHALLLDCRALTSRTAAIHPDIQIVICDTRAERSLAGSAYAERRAQCEEGARLLAQHDPAIRTLRDVSLGQFRAHMNDLPNEVARRCYFIIEENQRVLDLADALPGGDRDRIRHLAAASFAGARDLYEVVSPAMEAMMAAMLSGPGVIGARQAGAGFGGCLVAFVEAGSTAAFADHVTRDYQTLTGTEPQVYPVQAAAGAGLLVS